MHSVHWGSNPPQEKPPLFCQDPLNLQIPPRYCFFHEPLKVTKFLVKIFQFKFLVMTEKIYEPFFVISNISDPVKLTF